MYVPPHFQENDPDAWQRLIKHYPLAAIVTVDLDANHAPLLWSPEPAPHGTLRGHLAKANPQWRVPIGDVLAIFQGPQAYISPSMYASKSSDPRVVPTWNYAAVHAYGQLTTFDDPAQLRQIVRDLTVEHETGRPEPWSIDDAPTGYTEKLLNAIIGIEIKITRLECKWKVSQNRPEQDRESVAGAFETMARLVRGGR